MEEINIVSASTYEFLNNAYTKLMDKNAYLFEENERLKKCYYTTNKSWKELQIENTSLVNGLIELLKNNVIYQNHDGSYTATNIPKEIVNNLHIILKKYLRLERESK
jgi:hypothetical protein